MSEKDDSLRTTKKKLAVGKDGMCPVRDKRGHTTYNTDDIMKVAKQFYIKLQANKATLGDSLNLSTRFVRSH